MDLQRELKSSESVVNELRAKLTYHVGLLYDEVSAFLTTLLPTDDPGLGSVLIVDGLEKLRGTSQNDQAVQESIQALFVAHANKLRFHSHHLIYTVPTYLQFTAPGALPTTRGCCRYRCHTSKSVPGLGRRASPTRWPS